MDKQYPTVTEVRETRVRSQKIATRVTPAQKRALDHMVRRTGIPLSVVLRRAAMLWLRGELDLSQADNGPNHDH